MSLSNSVNTAVDNDTVLSWVRQYQTQRRKCDEENGVLRGIVKRAKADGVNTKAMIATVSLSKLDPEAVRADLRDQLRYMALRNMPTTQDDLFGGMDLTVAESSREQDEAWEADDAGYRAGKHGQQIDDCPYPPGTELHVHWVRSWHNGQAAIARELGEGASVASTSRARPVRNADASAQSTSEDGDEADLTPYADAADPVPPLTKRAAKTPAARTPRPRRSAKRNGAAHAHA